MVPEESQSKSEPAAQEQSAPRRGTTNVLLWGGAISAVLIIILVVMHFWLGTWLVSLTEYSARRSWHSVRDASKWMILNLPLWLVGKGQNVVLGQPLAEVTAGAAVVDLPSPADGRLLEKLVDEDTVVEVGQVLGVIQSDE